MDEDRTIEITEEEHFERKIERLQVIIKQLEQELEVQMHVAKQAKKERDDWRARAKIAIRALQVADQLLDSMVTGYYTHAQRNGQLLLLRNMLETERQRALNASRLVEDGDIPF